MIQPGSTRGGTYGIKCPNQSNLDEVLLAIKEHPEEFHKYGLEFDRVEDLTAIFNVWLKPGQSEFEQAKELMMALYGPDD